MKVCRNVWIKPEWNSVTRPSLPSLNKLLSLACFLHTDCIHIFPNLQGSNILRLISTRKYTSLLPALDAAQPSPCTHNKDKRIENKWADRTAEWLCGRKYSGVSILGENSEEENLNIHRFLVRFNVSFESQQEDEVKTPLLFTRLHYSAEEEIKNLQPAGQLSPPGWLINLSAERIRLWHHPAPVLLVWTGRSGICWRFLTQAEEPFIHQEQKQLVMYWCFISGSTA